MALVYTLPNEEERRLLFYYLKRGSSYTAWAEFRPYYKAFVDIVRAAFEDTQDNPSPNEGPLIEESQMATLLNGFASYEAALARLHKGDKTVFKFLGYGQRASPYFCEAFRVIAAWNSSNTGLAFAHGQDFPVWRSKFWPEIERALYRLNTVLCVCECLEDRHTDVPAPYYTMDKLAEGLNSQPVLRQVPRPLPEVPIPQKEVLVRTGQNVPFFGIWEPVKAPPRKSLLSMFKPPEIPLGHQFEMDGLMNYLHQGSPAPTIAFAEDDARNEGRSTIWRLIWADDRYADGAIPAEELEYQFEEPKDREPPKPPEPTPDIEWVFSGMPAPKDGVWACEVDLNWRIRLKKGELLPRRIETETVSWVHVPGV